MEGGRDMNNDKMDEYLDNLASHTQNDFYLKVIIDKEKLELKLKEAKKVIEYYANEDNWEKKPTEIGEFSLVCFDDRGGTARDLLEKWGEE